MRLLAHILVFTFTAISINAHAAGACPNGVLHVSSWNTIFDGTVSDINGCVVKHDDNEKISTTPQAGTAIPDTPAGWTAPTVGQIQPTPPSTATVQVGYTTNYDTTTIRPSIQAAGDYNCGLLNRGTMDHYTGTSSPWTPYCVISPTATAGSIFINNSCPAGYTASGSTCNLSNASAVIKPSDGKCTIIRSGNTFSADPQDPDCGTSTYTTLGVTVTSSKVSTPTRSVTINNDGSTTFNQTITNSNSTTTVSISNFSSAGINTGTSVQTYSGTGSLTSSTPTAVPTLDISSLNKETTQAAIKAGQCGGIGQPACKIDEGGTSDAQTTSASDNTRQRGELNAGFDAIQGQINGQTGGVGGGLTNPIVGEVPASQCTNPALDATDIHSGARAELHICERAQEIQPVLRWCTYIFSAFAIWGIWFTRLGG